MWELKKINGGTTIYLISGKSSYAVGRKNCDIVLEEDTSISRKHCTLYVVEKNQCNVATDTLTGICLLDENSKYGTYLRDKNEWKKIDTGSRQMLLHGSIIKFGVLENVWSLKYKPVIVSTSGIQAEAKKDIENMLKTIDGELRSSWSRDCTLIVVNEIILTVKVVLALVNGIPIVTPDYVKKLQECVYNKTSFPDAKEYQPVIKESVLDASLVSLDSSHTRKNLFKDHIFIFPTKKQLEILKEVILDAGGKVELLSSSCDWNRFEKSNIVLIQLPTNKSSIPEILVQKFEEITCKCNLCKGGCYLGSLNVPALLKNKYKRRVILESEIAQAIAYSSITKYCNPVMEDSQSNNNSGLGTVLVEETPDVVEKCIYPPFMVSNSGVESDTSNILSECDIPTNRKRVREADNLENMESSHSKISREKEKSHYFNKPNSTETLDRLVNPECSHYQEAYLDTGGNKGHSSKYSQSTDTFVTELLKNQNKELDEKLSQEKESFSDFWKSIKSKAKRKLSNECDGSEVKSGSKKLKLPTEENQKEISSSNNLNSMQSSFLKNNKHNIIKSQTITSRAINEVYENEENVTADFIGKETKETLMNCSLGDLNNTMYSLNLISSIYLKEDGTLVEPPSIPVNVKKFKKQKIINEILTVPTKSVTEELNEDGWLEPHSLNSTRDY